MAFPFTTFALEQSFTQNGLKTVIKLTPAEPVTRKEVNLFLRLEKDGQPVTDRKVAMEIHEKDATEPVIKREVDLLDNGYIVFWNLEKPSDYKVVISIADLQKPGEALHYEVKASVGDAKDAPNNSHGEHGFFSHHFGSKWGWGGQDSCSSSWCR